MHIFKGNIQCNTSVNASNGFHSNIASFREKKKMQSQSLFPLTWLQGGKYLKF